MKLEWAAKTHTGSRSVNEDWMGSLITPEWSCFIVADGCGAHEGSGLAACSFCEAVLEFFPATFKQLKTHPESTVTNLFNKAREKMASLLVASGFTDAQTTCAAVFIHEQQIIFAHVGDSRIYRLSPEGTWRTTDHSMVQALIDRKLLPEGAELSHPTRNILLRSIGIYLPTEPTILIDAPLTPADALVLCTDGFWEVTSIDQLLELAQAMHMDAALDRHIHQVLMMYSELDNLTVEMVRLA